MTASNRRVVVFHGAIIKTYLFKSVMRLASGRRQVFQHSLAKTLKSTIIVIARPRRLRRHVRRQIMSSKPHGDSFVSVLSFLNFVLQRLSARNKVLANTIHAAQPGGDPGTSQHCGR